MDQSPDPSSEIDGEEILLRGIRKKWVSWSFEENKVIVDRVAFILRVSTGDRGEPETGLSVHLLSETDNVVNLKSKMCPYLMKLSASSVCGLGSDISVVHKNSSRGAEITGLPLPDVGSSNAEEIAGRLLEMAEWVIEPDEQAIEAMKQRQKNARE
jgi:hypothetical protein